MFVLSRFQVKYDNRIAAAASTNGSQRIADLTALQNALNNNVYSVVNTAVDTLTSVEKNTATARNCSSASVRLSAGNSASNSSKLAVKCDRYKTELCRTYEENGTCRYGDKCQFAHGITELRTVARHPKYKTDLCRTFHTTGFCPYGSRCHFIHSLHETQSAVQLTTMPIQAASLLPPQLAVKSNNQLSAQVNSAAAVTEKQSLDSLLCTLSLLLQSNQLGSDQIASSLVAQEQAVKLAGLYAAGGFLPHGNTVPRGLSCDNTCIESASPCPSPTSLSGVLDDSLTFRPYFAASDVHLQDKNRLQSPVTVPSSILTPPNSPGSAASSLNSFCSDLDGYDMSSSRGSVWPVPVSPVKNVDVSLIPDFAHFHLLTSKHSVFA